MTCKQCKTELPSESVYCFHCGRKVNTVPARRMRANGSGSAYKRGRSWTAKYVLDWVSDSRITLGGFGTKKAALEFTPVLKASANIQPEEKRRNLLKQCKDLSVSEALKLLEAQGKTLAEADLTFKEIYERWLPLHSQRVGESTRKCYEAAFQYFKSLWHMRFTDLSTEDLQAAVDACPQRRRTKEDMRSLASQLYKWAASRKILTENYAQFIYCGKDDATVRPALTPEQVSKLREYLPQAAPEEYAEYVYCMCHLGFRPNEMLKLPKTAHHGEFVIGGFKTEAGTDRIVTISPKIVPILQKQLQTPGEYLFPKLDGSLMNDKYFRDKVFYPLMDKLGFQSTDPARPRLVPYSCRHTFANLLKNVKGADVDKAALMGHADANMTKEYQSAEYITLKAITDRI